MKNFLKIVLKFYLKWLTKLALVIHHPVIIVVAGSINKPFVKEEIKNVLIKKGLSVRANPKNFNTEIGLPLSVLYLNSGYNSFRDWLPVLFEAPRAVFKMNFPKFLVLGLGTSDPGDMKYLLSIIKPKVAVVTDITQRYIESFKDMDRLTDEYKLLISRVPADGLAVLNNDNNRVASIASAARCQVVTFGIDKKADYQAIGIERSSLGMKFTVKSAKGENQARIERFGSHHIKSHLIGEIIRKYVRG